MYYTGIKFNRVPASNILYCMFSNFIDLIYNIGNIHMCRWKKYAIQKLIITSYKVHFKPFTVLNYSELVFAWH